MTTSFSSEAMAALSEPPGPWPAPSASRPVDAVVTVPGSKSLTARALLIAAVADRPTVVTGALTARDTTLFARALQTLGASVEADGSGTVRVTPLPHPPVAVTDPGTASSMADTRAAATAARIDCGLAGTVMRFVPPIAALGSVPVTFDGDDAARVRPLAPLMDALVALGATVSYHGDNGFLPLTICGPLRTPLGGVVEVDASQSSQFVSALLMVAPLLDAPITVKPAGPIVSLPHIEMTVDTLRAAGVGICGNAASGWHIQPGRPQGGEVHIEPDLSNAGPFLAAAHLTGGTVTIPRWPESTTQAGHQWRHLLASLGARVSFTDQGLSMTGPGAGNFDGIDVDMSAVGELVPTLAAILLFARTPSQIRGVAHLRGHETDRLAALAAEIERLGGHATQTPDGLRIEPRALHGAPLRAYADHRMATFGAIVGLMVDGVTVDDIGTTSKTLPNFESMWSAMLAHTRDPRSC